MLCFCAYLKSCPCNFLFQNAKSVWNKTQQNKSIQFVTNQTQSSVSNSHKRVMSNRQQMLNFQTKIRHSTKISKINDLSCYKSKRIKVASKCILHKSYIGLYSIQSFINEHKFVRTLTNLIVVHEHKKFYQCQLYCIYINFSA